MLELENMGVMLRSVEYNAIEREIDQMTGFSNMLGRDDNEGTGSVRGNSCQENEIKNMPINRDNLDFSRNIKTLTGEKTLRISQKITSLLNGVNYKLRVQLALQYLRESSQGSRMSLRPCRPGNWEIYLECPRDPII